MYQKWSKLLQYCRYRTCSILSRDLSIISGKFWRKWKIKSLKILVKNSKIWKKLLDQIIINCYKLSIMHCKIVALLFMCVIFNTKLCLIIKRTLWSSIAYNRASAVIVLKWSKSMKSMNFQNSSITLRHNLMLFYLLWILLRF